MPCLFHLASYFQVSSVLLHVSELNFFLCLNNIPSYGYTTFFIHSSVDWPLSYFHLWALVNYASMNTGITSIHSSPCFQLLWVFMGGVELLDHMVILCLAFWGTTKHFFFNYCTILYHIKDLRITDFGIHRSPGTNPSRILNIEGGRILQTYGLPVLCKVLELHTFILSAIPMPTSGNIFT